MTGILELAITDRTGRAFERVHGAQQIFEPRRRAGVA